MGTPNPCCTRCVALGRLSDLSLEIPIGGMTCEARGRSRALRNTTRSGLESGDDGSFDRVVHHGIVTVEAVQRTVDLTRARRAGHSGDVELDRGGPGRGGNCRGHDTSLDAGGVRTGAVRVRRSVGEVVQHPVAGRELVVDVGVEVSVFAFRLTAGRPSTGNRGWGRSCRRWVRRRSSE